MVHGDEGIVRIRNMNYEIAGMEGRVDGYNFFYWAESNKWQFVVPLDKRHSASQAYLREVPRYYLSGHYGPYRHMKLLEADQRTHECCQLFRQFLAEHHQVPT